MGNPHRQWHLSRWRRDREIVAQDDMLQERRPPRAPDEELARVRVAAGVGWEDARATLPDAIRDRARYLGTSRAWHVFAYRPKAGV